MWKGRLLLVAESILGREHKGVFKKKKVRRRKQLRVYIYKLS